MERVGKAEDEAQEEGKVAGEGGKWRGEEKNKRSKGRERKEKEVREKGRIRKVGGQQKRKKRREKTKGSQ